MHFITSCAQIVLCSLVVYFALALYFYPTTPFPLLNKAGLLAWVHTCHFDLHVAGWMGPLPHLSFYSLPGGACPSLIIIRYLAGCVAATLIAIFIITRVCRCHRSCSHFVGCVFLWDNLVLSTELAMLVSHRKEIRISLRWLTYIVNSVDKTKLSCNIPTDAAPQFL